MHLNLLFGWNVCGGCATWKSDVYFRCRSTVSWLYGWTICYGARLAPEARLLDEQANLLTRKFRAVYLASISLSLSVSLRVCGFVCVLNFPVSL